MINKFKQNKDMKSIANQELSLDQLGILGWKTLYMGLKSGEIKYGNGCNIYISNYFEKVLGTEKYEFTDNKIGCKFYACVTRAMHNIGYFIHECDTSNFDSKDKHEYSSFLAWSKVSWSWFGNEGSLSIRDLDLFYKSVESM